MQDREQLKEQIAYRLYLGRFGDDSARNWRMAESLLQDAPFLEAAYDIKFGLAHGYSGATLYAMIDGLAEHLHRVSLGLDQPSHDPFVNQQCANLIAAGLPNPIRDALADLWLELHPEPVSTPNFGERDEAPATIPLSSELRRGNSHGSPRHGPAPAGRPNH